MLTERFRAKRFCAMLVFALWLTTGVVGAVDNSTIIQGYQRAGNELLVYLANGADSLASDQYEAHLSGTPFPVSNVKRAVDLPVTYYCLVDVSGSLDDNQFKQEKDVLTAICSGLSTGDRMVVAPLSNEVRASDYLTDQDAILNTINALEVTTEDTNLYRGIVSSLEELSTNLNASERKCLVILSDGKDDHKFSYTKNEVDDKIRETRIPVYGVAVMKSSHVRNDQWIGYAKELGSLARESAGGLYFNPVLGENCETADGAGAAVVESMNNGVKLALDLSGLDASTMPEESSLEIRRTTDSAVFQDTIRVRKQDIPAPHPVWNGIIQSYLASEDQRLRVFLTDPADSAEGQRYSALLDGASIPVVQVGSAAGQPVTYYCIADISGSVNQEMEALEKDILYSIQKHLGAEDCMVIARLGNQVRPTGYLHNAQEQLDAIGSLKISASEEADLYGGILSALEDLTSNSQAAGRKCVVLLSSGDSSSRSGFSRDEAERAVLRNRIPIYSVALLKNADAETGVSFLRSVSEQSAGGFYTGVWQLGDGIVPDEAGAAIVEDMENATQLILDISDIDRSSMDAEAIPLEVTREGGSETFRDTIYLSAQEIPSPPTPFPPIWLLAVIAAIVLAVVIILVVFLRGAKPKPKPEPEPEPELEPESMLESKLEPEPEPEPVIISEPEPDLPSCLCVFSAIGYRNLAFQLRIPENHMVTLGRDDRADLILNPEDRKLSGVHARIQLYDGYMMVSDAGSKNGTWVNGVPVGRGERVKLVNNGTLRMGSYEYRVQLANHAGAVRKG